MQRYSVRLRLSVCPAVAEEEQLCHGPVAGNRATVARHRSTAPAANAANAVLTAKGRQISGLVYPKVQRRQVIMNFLHSGRARPPRWSGGPHDFG